MKIEITLYGDKASYEFDQEQVSLEELIYSVEKLIKLSGYNFDGTLKIVRDEQ
jgi:hypothetical protein